MKRRIAKKVYKSLIYGYCDKNGINHNVYWSLNFTQDTVDKVLKLYRKT